MGNPLTRLLDDTLVCHSWGSTTRFVVRFDPQTIGDGRDAAEQLTGDARPHLHEYLRMLDGQLRGARAGRLSPTWRHGMASFARFFPPGLAIDDPLRAVCQPTPTPAMLVDPVLTGCLMKLPAAERKEHIISAKVAGVDLLAACAWFDVAELHVDSQLVAIPGIQRRAPVSRRLMRFPRRERTSSSRPCDMTPMASRRTLVCNVT